MSKFIDVLPLINFTLTIGIIIFLKIKINNTKQASPIRRYSKKHLRTNFSEKVREAVVNMPNNFTVKDIESYLLSKNIKLPADQCRTRIAVVLNVLCNKKQLVCVRNNAVNKGSNYHKPSSN